MPEGVTFDPIDRAFYAGSLNGGTITRVDADGTESVFFALESEVSFSGMKVDAHNRRLWVCASFRDPMIPLGEEGSLFTEIWIFDLMSGEKIHAYSLPAISPNARAMILTSMKMALAIYLIRKNQISIRLILMKTLELSTLKTILF